MKRDVLQKGKLNDGVFLKSLKFYTPTGNQDDKEKDTI